MQKSSTRMRRASPRCAVRKACRGTNGHFHPGFRITTPCRSDFSPTGRVELADGCRTEVRPTGRGRAEGWGRGRRGPLRSHLQGRRAALQEAALASRVPDNPHPVGRTSVRQHGLSWPTVVGLKSDLQDEAGGAAAKKRGRPKTTPIPRQEPAPKDESPSPSNESVFSPRRAGAARRGGESITRTR